MFIKIEKVALKMFWRKKLCRLFFTEKLQENCERAREKVKVKNACTVNEARAKCEKLLREFWVRKSEKGKVRVKVESHPEGVSEEKKKGDRKVYQFFPSIFTFSRAFFFAFHPPEESEWVWKMWKPNSHLGFHDNGNAETFSSSVAQSFSSIIISFGVSSRARPSRWITIRRVNDLIRRGTTSCTFSLSFWKKTRITFLFRWIIIGFLLKGSRRASLVFLERKDIKLMWVLKNIRNKRIEYKFNILKLEILSSFSHISIIQSKFNRRWNEILREIFKEKIYPEVTRVRYPNKVF